MCKTYVFAFLLKIIAANYFAMPFYESTITYAIWLQPICIMHYQWTYTHTHKKRLKIECDSS